MITEPKTFRFILHEDISNELQNIELYGLLKLIDNFTIRREKLGRYLYESQYHSIGVADYIDGLTRLLEYHNINIVMLPVRKWDDISLFNEIIYQPESKSQLFCFILDIFSAEALLNVEIILRKK